MKILIYAEDFHPGVGGVQNSSRLIAEHLSRRGDDVTVLTRTSEAGNTEFPFTILRNPPRDILRRTIARVDLVYLNGLGLGVFLYAKLRGKKTVMTYRDLTMVCPKGTKWKGTQPCFNNASPVVCIPCLRADPDNDNRILRRLIRPPLKSFISFFVDANVCTNRFGLERFKLHKKRLIFNGIDTRVFTPPESRKAGKHMTIVFIGRLIPEKGCQVLLGALGILKQKNYPFRAVICGDGPYRSSLINLADKYDIRNDVDFTGTRTGEALVETLQQADIAVVPSLIDEPFGLSAAEAMACELPVIASNVGGLGIMIKETGLLFERGDVSGLAEQLTHLAENPALRRRLGENGRSVTLSIYDSELMAESYYRLFHELCS